MKLELESRAAIVVSPDLALGSQAFSESDDGGVAEAPALAPVKLATALKPVAERKKRFNAKGYTGQQVGNIRD